MSPARRPGSHDPWGIAEAPAVAAAWKDLEVPRIRRFVGVASSGATRWIAAAPRDALAAPLQRLVAARFGRERLPELRWLLGRWPRGHSLVGLDTDAADAPLTLGLVAPLPPTRVALGHTPLPLGRDEVAHFKRLHEATAQPGLSGCRITLGGDGVQAIAGRWDLADDALGAVAALVGVTETAVHTARATLRDLATAMGRLPSVSLEASYSPAPPEDMTLELGPLPVAGISTLARLLGGTDAEAAAIAAAESRAPVAAAHRLRLTLRESECRVASVVLPLDRGSLKGPW